MASRLPSSEMDQKVLQIEACLARNPVNLWELRELALSRGGLVKCTLCIETTRTNPSEGKEIARLFNLILVSFSFGAFSV